MQNLPGFDSSTMTYFQGNLVQPPGGAGDQNAFEDLLLPMQMPDQHSTYSYAGSDEFNLQALQQQGQDTPSLQRFSSSVYEDPFSDVVSAFDHPASHEQARAEAPSIDRDNKLLSFSQPTFDYTLLDHTFRQTTISLSAQLHGMFFLAESPWASNGEAQAQSADLTCYRRNLFQISGDITLPRGLRYLLTEQGEQIPILGQELVMSAQESTEGNPVKVISVPWKTPAVPSTVSPDDKAEREPPSQPLDLMNVQELDSDFASFPVQWKRLQFRIATANNGRRKELQQHFVVRLKVVATLATGGKATICEAHSGPIIVRGRSPRNFQSRKDTPLGGSGHARKASSVHPNRPSFGDSAKRSIDAAVSAPVKHKPQAPMVPQQQAFFGALDAQPNPDIYDWKDISQAQPGARTSIPYPTTSPSQPGDPNPYAASSPEIPRRETSKPNPKPPAPINLSLVEDDAPSAAIVSAPSNPSTTPSSSGPAAKKPQVSAREPSFSLHTVNSPDESADLLYEYFPLGLDDWMPPVDAVYRPHVVHHTKLPTDQRDPMGGNRNPRSKRYFVEEDGV